MCGVNCICSNVGVAGCDVVMDGCVVLDDWLWSWHIQVWSKAIHHIQIEYNTINQNRVNINQNRVSLCTYLLDFNSSQHNSSNKHYLFVPFIAPATKRADSFWIPSKRLVSPTLHPSHMTSAYSNKGLIRLLYKEIRVDLLSLYLTFFKTFIFLLAFSCMLSMCSANENATFVIVS